MSENTIVSTVNWTIDWIQERIKERTSWDGFTIIVFSVLVLSKVSPARVARRYQETVRCAVEYCKLW